jgi:hypothetical protein
MTAKIYQFEQYAHELAGKVSSAVAEENLLRYLVWETNKELSTLECMDDSIGRFFSELDHEAKLLDGSFTKIA